MNAPVRPSPEEEGRGAHVRPDPNPPVVSDVPSGRHWYIDEIVVVAFAFLGVGGSVFLIVRFGFNAVPPIMVAFLLSTGLAALTYRFLGGIDAGTSFKVGALKLTGSLAALVGIALVVNHYLADQVKQVPVYYLHGRVIDEQQKPISGLNDQDFEIFPAHAHAEPMGEFTVEYIDNSSVPGATRPFLKVKHEGYGPVTVPLMLGELKRVYPDVKIQGKQISLDQIKIVPVTAVLPQTMPATPQQLAPGQLSNYTAATQSAPTATANFGGVPK